MNLGFLGVYHNILYEKYLYSVKDLFWESIHAIVNIIEIRWVYWRYSILSTKIYT